MYTCERCGRAFEKGFDKNNRFCSKHCFYSHPLTEEQKNACSKRALQSERVSYAKKKRDETIKWLNETECVCQKCGKTFKGDYRKFNNLKKKDLHLPYYCSSSCAHSRVHDNAYKEALSKTMKECYGGAAKLSHTNQKTDAMLQSEELSKATIENGKLIKANCLFCNKEFVSYKYRHKKYCSIECWRKSSGGYREGSVKNHVHGWYEGYYYDSSWELAWLKWAIENKVNFERNTKGFDYVFNGETHKYFPDFYLKDEDAYLEIKGIEDERWEAKKKAFPHKLIVLNKQSIQKYL